MVLVVGRRILGGLVDSSVLNVLSFPSPTDDIFWWYGTGLKPEQSITLHFIRQKGTK